MPAQKRYERRIQHGLPTPASSPFASLRGTPRGGSICSEVALPSYGFPLPGPSTYPERTLDIDVGTPDEHVARDPRLVRLTGVHPFNVEAPLTDLFREGEINS